MGCPLDGGDNVKTENNYYALGQGGFCGMHGKLGNEVVDKFTFGYPFLSLSLGIEIGREIRE